MGQRRIGLDQLDETVTDAINNAGGGGGSPSGAGGADTNVQYNNGGVLGGIADWSFNDAQDVMTMTFDNTGSVSNDPIQIIADDLTAGHAINIDVGNTGNLTTGGAIKIIGKAGGGNTASGILFSQSRNATPAIWAEAGTIANARALHVYSNTGSRTLALALIENDNAAGSGVGLEIQNDASGAHIELTGANGEGIKFTSNQASTDVNTLDYYQEGTFTPVIEGTSAAGAGTYSGSGQVGEYTKIGTLVHCQIYLNWTAHTGTGNMKIAGLPFTAKNVTSLFSPAAIWVLGVSLTDDVIQGYVSPNTDEITLSSYAVSTTTTNSVPMDTLGTLMVQVSYIAA